MGESDNEWERMLGRQLSGPVTFPTHNSLHFIHPLQSRETRRKTSSTNTSRFLDLKYQIAQSVISAVVFQ